MRVVIVLLLCTLFKYFNLNEAKTGQYGPYKARVLSFTPCKKPNGNDANNSFIYFKAEPYNNSRQILIRGNATVFKDNQNLKMRSKRYLWENGKWNLNFMMNNIGCRGLLMQIIVAATGFKYDSQRCSILKGSYIFDELDIDKQLHLWSSTMEYGRMLWTFEMYTKVDDAVCLEFTINLEALDKNV